MDYLRGYKAITQDPNWTGKFLWASLFVLSSQCIPIVGQAVVVGWASMSMRHVLLSKGDLTLPRLEWDTDYIVQLLLAGLKQYAVLLVWTLPMVLLMLIIMVPLSMLGGAVASEAGEAGGLAMMCLMVVLFPLLFLMMIPAQVAVLRMELTDDFKQAFEIGEVINFTKMMFVPIMIGSVLVSLVSMVLVFVGMLACFVGIFPAVVATMYAWAQLRAVIYEAYLQKGGRPLNVIKPVATAYDDSYSGDASVFA